METTNIVEAPQHYNPNQLVTYKVISNDTTTYPTTKVTDIEWALESYRTTKQKLNEYISKVSQLEEQLPEYLEMDSEEIVSNICSIFGFNPTKEIEFEATVTIQGVVTVPLSDVADFDIESIDLNVDATSWSHDVEINNVEVDNITSL